ncbi:Zn(II)2Cys6 transcription factor [Aspergillus saccharolyticus JOP 1030-1]|uniref:C6 transcription factor n=1 Tax=Aspergillus saccharolyticus JOP 1030-1 TaxID=1450539 RepID=A0A318Z8L3_9EURO|nr:C6 transcription factor [Aspergillus saccharolyticus JOP 1030-1]PYH43596.1 C6 transcription factor [Aspergillus saccharolyticus JOP 1030-1]
MSELGSQHRQIAPGPSPSKSEKPPSRESSPDRSFRTPTDVSKKRVSMACLACKKSKRKCSGVPPCDNCRAFNRQCIFDETLDQRRRVAAKRTADELSYHRDMLNDLLKVMRAEDQSYGLKLLEIIRNDASAEEIRAFIDEILGQDGGESKVGEEAECKLEEVRRVIDVEGAGPSFRPKVMDIHYLCDEVPYRVPARPWTTVTEDADLVSHLVSLYFTWDYPFHAFLDRDVFLEHMRRGDLQSEFCSPFLVNALLTNACHFSDYSEAYVAPGDIVTKGVDFLTEAERLREEEPLKLSLAYLQGTLLLYERYSMSCEDDRGYQMLHHAIWTGESLGLIGPRIFSLSPGQVPNDKEISVERSAWGLFHIDTLVHAQFLRPSLIDKVNLQRPDRYHREDSNLWVPYPSHRPARVSYLSQYFSYSCDLCEIARDISQTLFSVDGGVVSIEHQQKSKERLFERLRGWYATLPDVFEPSRRPPPYIILLRMRYHTLVITLFSYNTGRHDPSPGAEAPQTPESPPGSSPFLQYSAPNLVQSAARAISGLTLLHRCEYGISRAHHFAMYAINLALFTLLDPESFDILDRDFLSLASSFSSMASRSLLGRCLFHMFRQTVRSRGQGKHLRESSLVSDELKALFDEESTSPSQWDEYAKGLDKLEADDRYHGLIEEEYSLLEMLDRYESLSLGKDEIAPERRRR